MERFENQRYGALVTRLVVSTKDCGLYFDACVSLHSGEDVLATGIGVGRSRDLAIWSAVRDLRERRRVTLPAAERSGASTSPSD